MLSILQPYHNITGFASSQKTTKSEGKVVQKHGYSATYGAQLLVATESTITGPHHMLESYMFQRA